MTKYYLGDGVYAEDDGCGQIKLITSNGINESEPIYIEFSVFRNLLGFAENIMGWRW